MIEIPADLKARLDALLAKLAVLSDAPTQRRPDASPLAPVKEELAPGKTWKGGSRNRQLAATSRPPRGVAENRPLSREQMAPHPDHHPLFDWVVWRVGRARSLREIRALVLEAEIRYQKAVCRGEPRPHALAANPETTDERNRRIAEDYEGLSPDEVAAVETERSGWCSAENVRRERAKRRRHPDTGAVLPEEASLRGKERTVRAAELVAAGVSVSEVARRFGVAPSTVSGWLGRRRDPRRAA
jgi:hypothetical protein